MSSLTGWGRVPRVTASIVSPTRTRDAFSFVQSSALPRGLGRSYGDASLPAAGIPALSSGFLNRYISLNPSTGEMTAEAGVSLGDVLETLVPRGFFPPVTPGTQYVTLGGAVASNVHGKNHHHCGSIEHFTTSLEVATPAGLLTCSPVENPDLFRATVGGYGLTGLITKVGLRLKPVSSAWIKTRAIRCRNLQELFAGFREQDTGYEYSVAWVDTMAGGRGMGKGLLLLGNHDTSSSRKPPKLGHQLFNVPFSMPSGLLQPWALRLFNNAFYHLPRSPREKTEAYEGFFYPLDRIGNWNRLYGSQGFFQYQCVIPDPDGEKGVEACLRFLTRHGMGSFLAVLKRCGDDTVLLPFCKRGFTLALDIPSRGAETLRRLDDLDQIVLEFGGRVYLTKDARLSKKTFRAMYPEWQEWMNTVRQYNPAGTGRSLLSERLGLWDA